MKLFTVSFSSTVDKKVANNAGQDYKNEQTIRGSLMQRTKT